MKNFAKKIPAFIFLSALVGCYYDKFDEFHPASTSVVTCDTTAAMSYATNIVPILNANCGTNNSCHNATNTSGVDLSGYNGTHAVAVQGRLVSSVIWDGNASQMPQNSTSKISACDQAKIKKWVAAGALNN